MLQWQGEGEVVLETWDHSVDVLIVGSGNGGMTAALCCHEMGAKDTLVIEKAPLYGGTSSTSGGGVWVPCNRYAREAGVEDSLEDAMRYARDVTPTEVGDEKLLAYLREGPRMIDFLHERTRVRYRSLAHYPDYYTDVPGSRDGHRSMEPEPIRHSDLGSEAAHLTATHHMMMMFDRIGMTQEEARILFSRLKGWFGITFRLMLRHGLDVSWWLRHKRSRVLTCGSAGIARLRLSMLDRDMPLWLETDFEELVTDQFGKVTGAVVRRDGETLRIQARKGVILAAGGFEFNQQMREAYLPKPTSTAWSAAHGYNTGAAIVAGEKLGAATAFMNGAWWCTTLCVPGEPRPRLGIVEKSLPGAYVVNPAGERFSNESQNYMSYLLELFEIHSDANPCLPMFMVFDAKFRKKYIAGPLLTPDVFPDWMIPKRWYDEGFLYRANTIEELARKAGIDVAGFTQTVERVNGYSKTGNDLDLKRGDTAYDRYYGDPTVTPNPCLAPLDTPPYYAMRLEPGDFGTQGGLVTDAEARVMHKNGKAIPGLYAIGNCAEPILPTYPGPGATLGPAMTFGYLAAREITSSETNHNSEVQDEHTAALPNQD